MTRDSRVIVVTTPSRWTSTLPGVAAPRVDRGVFRARLP
jgi:hypothetical protein